MPVLEKRTVVIFISIIKCLIAVQTEYDQLYHSLFTNYNPRVMPLIKQGDTVIIWLRVYAVSINNFDQRSGELSMTTLFNLSWTDTRLAWNSSVFNNISIISLTTDDIWFPRLFVRETSDKIKSVGIEMTVVSLASTGDITWAFGHIIKVTCSLDVRYFPYDTQLCPITLSSATYDTTQYRQHTATSELDLSLIAINSEWEVLPSSIKNGTSNAIINLRLKRRADFYTVYIIAPVILLGIITNFVFLMPASSGERTSVAITTLLSFVVYMDIVNDHVPESSTPITYLYKYLLFLMLYSSITMLLTIISFRIHERENEVPGYLQKVIPLLRLHFKKSGKASAVCPVEENDSQKQQIVNLKEIAANEDQSKQNDHGLSNETKVTWKTVSGTFDIYCAIVLMVTFIGFTIDTFTKITTNTGL